MRHVSGVDVDSARFRGWARACWDKERLWTCTAYKEEGAVKERLPNITRAFQIVVFFICVTLYHSSWSLLTCHFQRSSSIEYCLLQIEAIPR